MLGASDMRPVWQQVSLVAFCLCLRTVHRVRYRQGGLLGVGAIGAGCLAYAGLYEVNAFRLRRVDGTGAAAGRAAYPRTARVRPAHDAAREGPAALAVHAGALEPDLVINTGDNLAHHGRGAVRAAAASVGCLIVPGVYVWGVERLLRARRSRTRCAISRVRAGAIGAEAHSALAGSWPRVQGGRAGST